MSIVTSQPSTQSLLSPIGFKFILRRAPNVQYFVTSCNLPGITLSQGEMVTPFVPIPTTGSIEFDTLTVSFKVTKDLSNYLEIWNWMTDLGSVYSAESYRQLYNNDQSFSGEGVKSDATLQILTAHMNPGISVDFYDCFPINLSEINFDGTLTDVEYVTATATFRFLRMQINT